MSGLITQLQLIKFFLWAYVAYAFFTSLIREIIKDIEDVEGDKKCNCSTLPVVIGVKKTKYVLMSLCFIAITSLAYVSYLAHSFHFTIIFWYLILLLILPYIYIMYILLKAQEKSDFSFLSNLMKFIMVAGVASMALVFPLF
jgi:4-hydroxybenzoate polyprenyltransferase